MITAKLVDKPYIEISESMYDQLAKSGQTTLKISFHDTKGHLSNFKADRKKLLEFVENTLGIWADDKKIDQAFDELDQRWQQWREETLS